MLTPVDLDYTDFHDLWKLVLEELEQAERDWTARGDSDPGITILEQFAMLYDMQHYYRNQISSLHKEALLGLLGIRPEGRRPSEGFVSMENINGHRLIPRGMKFYAGSLVFETQKEYETADNRIVSFRYGKEDKLNLVPFMQLDKRYGFKPSGSYKEQFLYIGLQKPVHKREFLTVFFGVEEKEEYMLWPGRKIVWESYGAAGWKKMKVYEDETDSLDKSGNIMLQLLQDMKPAEAGSPCFIRGCMEKDPWRRAPAITEVMLNTVAVSQTDTLSCSFDRHVCIGEGEGLAVRHYLAAEGETLVFLKEKDGLFLDVTKEWRQEKSPEGVCLFPPAKVSGTVRLVCRTEDFKERYREADMTGETMMRVSLNGLPVLPDKLKLMIKEGKNKWREYKMKKEGAEAADGYGFRLDPVSEELLFGNGRDFKIPPKADKGCLLTDLVLCSGKTGNAAAGKIDRVNLQVFGENLVCRNPYTMKGGRDKETIEEAAGRAAESLAGHGAAVTPKDYEEKLLVIPGEAAAVKVSRRSEYYGDIRKTGFIVQVKMKEGIPAPEGYAGMIIKYLERWRMLTDRLEVIVEE